MKGLIRLGTFVFRDVLGKRERRGPLRPGRTRRLVFEPLEGRSLLSADLASIADPSWMDAMASGDSDMASVNASSTAMPVPAPTPDAIHSKPPAGTTVTTNHRHFHHAPGTADTP